MKYFLSKLLKNITSSKRASVNFHLFHLFPSLQLFPRREESSFDQLFKDEKALTSSMPNVPLQQQDTSLYTSCFFPTSHTLGFHFITHQLGKYISNQPPVKSKQVFTFTLSHLSGLNLHLEAILISISRSQLCKDKKVIFLPRQKRTLILICQKFKLMTKY